MFRRLLAERKAVFAARLVEDFGLHARDVHAGGAFRLARLAADAEVHDLLHAPPVSSSGGRVPSITDLSMLARALVVSCSSRVTMYEGTSCPVLLRQSRSRCTTRRPSRSRPDLEGEVRLYGRRSRPGPIRSCRSIGGGSTITPGFIIPSGSKRRLTSAKARRISPVHLLHELRTREAVAVLTGDGPAAVDDEVRDLLGDAPHPRDAIGSEVSRAGLTCRHPTLAWP